VVGKKIWKSWELDLGKASRPKQPYFTEAQLKQIIAAAPERFRVLFILLAGTGMRIGEALALNRARIWISTTGSSTCVGACGAATSRRRRRRTLCVRSTSTPR
jgi:integrase